MRPPAQPAITLPATQAQRITDLLCTAGYLISALRARSQNGNPAMAADLEDLSALLTGGGDTIQLISDLQAAQRGLAAAMLARSPR